jgi:hypothetical protein
MGTTPPPWAEPLSVVYKPSRNNETMILTLPASPLARATT